MKNFIEKIIILTSLAGCIASPLQAVSGHKLLSGQEGVAIKKLQSIIRMNLHKKLECKRMQEDLIKRQLGKEYGRFCIFMEDYSFIGAINRTIITLIMNSSKIFFLVPKSIIEELNGITKEDYDEIFKNHEKNAKDCSFIESLSPSYEAFKKKFDSLIKKEVNDNFVLLFSSSLCKNASDYTFGSLTPGLLTSEEYECGIKINHLKTMDKYALATMDIKDFDDKNVLDAFNKIFVTKKEYKKNKTGKQKPREWIFYINGHGTNPQGLDRVQKTAGITFPQVDKILNFMRLKIVVSFLMLASCYTGKERLANILQAYELGTQTGIYRAPLPFPVATGITFSTVSLTKGLNTDFNNFFEELENIFPDYEKAISFVETTHSMGYRMQKVLFFGSLKLPGKDIQPLYPYGKVVTIGSTLTQHRDPSKILNVNTSFSVKNKEEGKVKKGYPNVIILDTDYIAFPLRIFVKEYKYIGKKKRIALFPRFVANPKNANETKISKLIATGFSKEDFLYSVVTLIPLPIIINELELKDAVLRDVLIESGKVSYKEEDKCLSLTDDGKFGFISGGYIDEQELKSIIKKIAHTSTSDVEIGQLLAKAQEKIKTINNCERLEDIFFHSICYRTAYEKRLREKQLRAFKLLGKSIVNQFKDEKELLGVPIILHNEAHLVHPLKLVLNFIAEKKMPEDRRKTLKEMSLEIISQLKDETKLGHVILGNYILESISKGYTRKDSIKTFEELSLTIIKKLKDEEELIDILLFYLCPSIVEYDAPKDSIKTLKNLGLEIIKKLKDEKKIAWVLKNSIIWFITKKNTPKDRIATLKELGLEIIKKLENKDYWSSQLEKAIIKRQKINQ